MKSTIRVLWVDDEWLPDTRGELSNDLFAEWESSWRRRLAASSIDLQVVRSASPEVLDKVVGHRFDVLILDYGYARSRGLYQNAVELLSVMRAVPRAAEVPAVILSKLSAGELDHLSLPQLHGVYVKNEAGIDALGAFLDGLARPRSLNLLLMSDLHVGFLPQRAVADGTLHHDRFFRSLTDRIGKIARESRIDGVVIAGDFAWHDPSGDLKRAAVTVDQIVRAAGVSMTSGLLICPGNHDLCYDRTEAGDWVEFRDFVDKLAIGSGDAFLRRFANVWNPTTRRLGEFHSQNALLSVVVNHESRFVFVGLNSCRTSGKKFECKGVIDGDQWDDVARYLEGVPADYLRIGALHHPIFSPPDGFWRPDYAMVNQGSALRYLTKNRFSLVVHGHTHFAGVHMHKVRSLNRPGVARDENDEPSLLAVSCPSVLAEPDPNTPSRQFFFVKLQQSTDGRQDWDFSLSSYVFEPSGCTWGPGEPIRSGDYSVMRRN